METTRSSTRRAVPNEPVRRFIRDSGATLAMSDIGRIERRLSALERAVVDGDPEVAALEDLASLAADLETAAERLEAHDRRLADLEGRVDALEGAVGGVEGTDAKVERRANAAVAAVDRLEYRMDGLEQALEGPRDRTDPRPVAEPGDEETTERAATTEPADARAERDAASPSVASTGAAGGSGERPDVERTVEAIVSAADDGGRSSDGSPSDPETDGAAATDEINETTGLFGSIRARLP